MPTTVNGFERYIDNELPVEPDFEIPENHNFTRTPDELIELMGKTSWEFAQASRFVRELEQTKKIREAKVRVILLSRSVRYLSNDRLRHHLLILFEDPKFKWTVEDLKACIILEQEEIMLKYNKYEKIADQAKKEFEMYQSQLMWYQSKMKQERNERIAQQ